MGKFQYPGLFSSYDCNAVEVLYLELHGLIGEEKLLQSKASKGLIGQKLSMRLRLEVYTDNQADTV